MHRITTKHLPFIFILNPVKKHLCDTPFAYRYSSAFPGWILDPIPQGLKPIMFEVGAVGTAEAVPFQSKAAKNREGIVEVFSGTAEVVPFQIGLLHDILKKRKVERNNATQK